MFEECSANHRRAEIPAPNTNGTTARLDPSNNLGPLHDRTSGMAATALADGDNRNGNGTWADWAIG